MQNNDFDPQAEFEKATQELNSKKKSGSPFENIFSKKDNAKESSMISSADMDMSVEDRFDFNADNTVLNDNYDSNVEQLRDQVNMNDTEVSDSPRKAEAPKSAAVAKILKVFAALLIVTIIGLLVYVFFLKPSPVPVAEVENQETVEPSVVETPVDTSGGNSDSEGKDEPEEVATDEVSPADLAAPEDKNKEESEGDETEASTDSDEPTTAEADTEVNNEIASEETVSEEKPVIIPDDSEEILSAEIPEDEALVKEELDKLEDKGERLVKQEELLTQRVEMMDELTQKKEEQIALLEKQIAELEAKTDSE